MSQHGFAVELSGELVKAHALAATGGNEDGGDFRFHDKCFLTAEAPRSLRKPGKQEMT